MLKIASHEGFEHLQGRPPNLEPFRTALAGMRRAGRSQEAALVETHMAGGLVTQSDLYGERAELSPLCQWCVEAPGTAHHR
eukprot:9298895-Pyramimonas_sp.AAC.1